VKSEQDDAIATALAFDSEYLIAPQYRLTIIAKEGKKQEKSAKNQQNFPKSCRNRIALRNEPIAPW